jgi:hypothetical protein
VSSGAKWSGDMGRRDGMGVKVEAGGEKKKRFGKSLNRTVTWIIPRLKLDHLNGANSSLANTNLGGSLGLPGSSAGNYRFSETMAIDLRAKLKVWH